MDYVSLDQRQPVAILTFERPYSLCIEGLGEVQTLLESLVAVKSIRALIVTGKVEEAFLADVPKIKDLGPLQAYAFSELGQHVCAMLESLPYPTIAAIDGLALGGGCEIALACDIAYASDRAKFGQIECKGGIIPGFGGTKRLTRRVGHQRACQMIFTASVIDAEQAEEYGLVLGVIESLKLLEHCRQVAAQIADNAPLAVAEAKRILAMNNELSLETAVEVERRAFAVLFATKDQKEAMTAFIEKRPAMFSGE